MSDLPLEKNLNDLFTKSAPALPAGGKKALTEVAPWLALIGGVLSLLAALSLWRWANVANDLADYANTLSEIYGVNNPVVDRLTMWVWVGLVFLVVEGLLYLFAFPKLRKREKGGWNLLYIGALLNIVYGLVVLFTDYGGPGNFVGSLIFSAIGLYLLFQIRSNFTGVAPAAAPQPPTDKPADKPAE